MAIRAQSVLALRLLSVEPYLTWTRLGVVYEKSLALSGLVQLNACDVLAIVPQLGKRWLRRKIPNRSFPGRNGILWSARIF